MNRKILLIALSCLLTGTAVFSQSILSCSDPHIRYAGRTTLEGGAMLLAWPGTSVDLNFYGTGMKVRLKDEWGGNYYNIILDGKIAGKLAVDSGTKDYTLVTGLTEGRHSLELFKRTEWAMGRSWLVQFVADGKGYLLDPPAAKKRKIEFYGNSITCGYAVEDSSGLDRGSSPYENGYISYAALTARHFDADFRSISRSGIGILVSWFHQIMPELYDRLDPADSSSKWDFSSYTPDIVIINLFQNDSWLVNRPDHSEFKARFGSTAPSAGQIVEAYRAFVRSIRAKYPHVPIICALGNMDATKAGAPWPGYIEEAVASLHDKDIYTHFFPYKNTAGHPNAKEQQAMADDLSAFITKTFHW